MKINVTVEITKNSNIKYEINTKTNELFVDRILFGTNKYPHNYGFIEETLDYDGDPLDVLIISNEGFLPTAKVPTRIIGAMNMIDNGETDTKLIGVIDVDPRFDHIKSINDLNKNVLNEIEDFFLNYKNLQKKIVVINGFKDLNYAKEIFNECKSLYTKYKDWDNKAFIAEMKKLYPQKYK